MEAKYIGLVPVNGSQIVSDRLMLYPHPNLSLLLQLIFTRSGKDRQTKLSSYFYPGICVLGLKG